METEFPSDGNNEQASNILDSSTAEPAGSDSAKDETKLISSIDALMTLEEKGVMPDSEFYSVSTKEDLQAGKDLINSILNETRKQIGHLPNDVNLLKLDDLIAATKGRYSHMRIYEFAKGLQVILPHSTESNSFTDVNQLRMIGGAHGDQPFLIKKDQYMQFGIDKVIHDNALYSPYNKVTLFNEPNSFCDTMTSKTVLPNGYTVKNLVVDDEFFLFTAEKINKTIDKQEIKLTYRIKIRRDKPEKIAEFEFVVEPTSNDYSDAAYFNIKGKLSEDKYLFEGGFTKIQGRYRFKLKADNDGKLYYDDKDNKSIKLTAEAKKRLADGMFIDYMDFINQFGILSLFDADSQDMAVQKYQAKPFALLDIESQDTKFGGGSLGGISHLLYYMLLRTV